MSMRSPRINAIQISGAYFIAASLWIVFSDILVAKWFSSLSEFSRASQYKGLAFVALTTILLYVVLRSRLATVERSKSAVEASERRFAAFMENFPGAAFLKDKGGRYVYVNRYWIDNLSGGMRWEGRTSDSIFAADLVELANEDHNRVLAGDALVERFLTLPVKGRDREFLVRRFPVRSGQELLVGAFAIDITEQRKLEEQLHQAAKMEAIGQLAGGIAHDFNNLLTVIGGYAQLLSISTPDAALIRRAAAEITKASERATMLTSQLLVSSRKQVAQLAPLDVNASIHGLLSVIERLVGENTRIERNLEAELPSIIADRIQIDQVLLNIILNARDAMPAGGRIEVSTRLRSLSKHEASLRRLAEGQYVVLSIADQGHGMDERTLARLFEPFFTTKEPGRGTGLGLATVYGIVQSCRGAIHVESTPGKGSTFDVYFPIADSAATEPTAAVPAPAGHGRVLLVEDDDAVRELAVQFLQSCGYNVVAASSGAEALQVFARWQSEIHLLISDVAMPEMDGPELLRRLRSVQPELRALFLTGYSGDLEADLADLGEVPVVSKPFSIETLAMAVQRAIETPSGQEGTGQEAGAT